MKYCNMFCQKKPSLQLAVYFSDLIRKEKKKKYNPENLERAMIVVKAGTMTQHQAARVFGVPQSTIGSRISRWKSRQST